ncbi:MAG: phosphatase PAP2 family protein [Pseudohongiellaceae bacterium]|jgi:membrane-associated PAP2 superfamily phosphatase
MLRTHLLLPSLLLLPCAVWLELAQVDLWWADRLYAWSGGQWSWRDAWLTATLVHEGGRQLVSGLALCLLLLALASARVTVLRAWRAALLSVLVTAVVGALLVNVAKRLTHVDCPWDLLRYGGELPYVRVFEPHPRTFAYGQCFPAGHASAGYAWFGLYFLVRAYRPRWRWLALGAVLTVGGVFGLAQQMRGAHFLSHDVWSLLICWTTATLVYRWAPYGQLPTAAALTGKDD